MRSKCINSTSGRKSLTANGFSDYHYYYYYYYKCQDLSDAITSVAGALYKVYQ